VTKAYLISGTVDNAANDAVSVREREASSKRAFPNFVSEDASLCNPAAAPLGILKKLLLSKNKKIKNNKNNK
jgi:hypothetical protein